jgi:hypothetical protein
MIAVIVALTVRVVHVHMCVDVCGARIRSHSDAMCVGGVDVRD